MLISRNWLQTFFERELPAVEVLEDALTFHAFEIDGVENKNGDDVLDVKITPNRGHDCLCHRGIAKELSAILQIPLKKDPLTVPAASLFAENTLH
jgi:phenylalanyl-tRNA synthetase beta subunit